MPVSRLGSPAVPQALNPARPEPSLWAAREARVPQPCRPPDHPQALGNGLRPSEWGV